MNKLYESFIPFQIEKLQTKRQLYEHISGGKRNGFFIESGAYDGEAISNSLFFELERNFTGK